LQIPVFANVYHALYTEFMYTRIYEPLEDRVAPNIQSSFYRIQQRMHFSLLQGEVSAPAANKRKLASVLCRCRHLPRS
jgi:hypothetical protein